MRGYRPAFLAAIALVAAGLGVIVTPAPASALTTAAQVASGGRTTCAVMTGGNAYCWGDNTYGQLGNGTTTSSATPVLVSGGYTWATISIVVQNNAAAVCGVTTAGVGYCWGANNNGQVGDNTTTQRTTPTAVSGGYTWASISAGYYDACGVTTSGSGYCWGANNNGQIGNGTTTNSHTPTAVSGGYTWASISEGTSDSCGVTTAGVGYCWGENLHGEVGDTTTTQRTTPTAVSGGYTWASISSSAQFASCGVTTAGAGYCWGYNNAGQVGDTTTTDRSAPTAVSGSYTWSTIVSGYGTSCGITTGNVTYCWGSNNAGQIGIGNTTTQHSPVTVNGGQTYSSIVNQASPGDSGYGTTCGLTLDGIIYCWGYNNYSEVGDGTTTNRNVPTEASQLYAASANVTMSVTIEPAFTFTVANQASACNGESNFVSGAGTASTVALGNLAAGANVTGGQALSVTGNSGGGFTVYVAGTQASQNLRSAGHNWADVSGTYASPAALGSGERFGYTYHDSTSSSSVTNPASANFIALTNATTNAVMGSTTSESGSGCVSYDAQTSASTPAASYSATIIYTAVPTF